MPVDTKGRIKYKNVDTPGHMRLQTDPPVCNYCKQAITRANFGWACPTSDGLTLGEYECVECTACTLIRDGGTALLSFLQRHKL